MQYDDKKNTNHAIASELAPDLFPLCLMTRWLYQVADFAFADQIYNMVLIDSEAYQLKRWD